MLTDLRYALRTFARSPLFTAAVVLVLGLGIGASTTVFSLVDAYLLKPLPFNEPERLMSIWVTRGRAPDGFDTSPFSSPDFVDLREQATSFSHLSVVAVRTFNLAGDGRSGSSAESVLATMVTPSFFPMLGTTAAIGRTFTPDEDMPGHEQVVVLSDALWRKHFGADPSLVGRTITLEGKPYQIVGVMPPAFRMPTNLWSADLPDLWTPAAFVGENANRRDRHGWTVLGRLKPGVSPVAANAEVRGIAKRLEQAYPDSNAKKAFYSVPLQEHMVSGIRPALTVLFAATLLLLVIASTNVALLLLARAAARESEVAVRAALGASRSRIVRQFLAESVLLALFGGALGFLISFVGVDLVAAGYKDAAFAARSLHPDARVLAFSLALASLTGLGFGLLPALRASKTRLYELLKEGASRSTSSGQRRRLQGSLLVAEVALSAVLLAGSTAVARGFYKTLNQPLGFKPEGTLTFSVHLPQDHYASPQRARAFSETFIERLRALPGVRAAGMANFLPLTGQGMSGWFEIEGRPPVPKGEGATTEYQRADTGYFDAMGIRLVRGRLFTEADREGTAPVMLVSESFAREHFGAEDPIGKRVRWMLEDNQWREVVGVVGDVRYDAGETQSRFASYLPYGQETSSRFGLLSFVVRSQGDPRAIANTARDALAGLDAELPLRDLKTYEERASDSLADRRFTLWLVTSFALSALVLTALGLFGLVSYQTRRRSRELAIRMALGAASADVQRLVFRDTSRLLLAGLALGLPAAFAAGRLLASKLEGVPPTDLLSLVATALVLGLVALAAVLAPARRAARTPPALVLRDD